MIAIQPAVLVAGRRFRAEFTGNDLPDRGMIMATGDSFQHGSRKVQLRWRISTAPIGVAF